MTMESSMRAYLLKLLISLDQLVNTVLGGECDETLSARCWRRGYTRRIALLDAIFGENHCKHSYMSEKIGTQYAPEYKQ